MVKAVELLTRDSGRPERYGEEIPFEKILKFSCNCLTLTRNSCHGSCDSEQLEKFKFVALYFVVLRGLISLTLTIDVDA